MRFKNSNHIYVPAVIFLVILQLPFSSALFSQPLNKKNSFTRQDTLRGSIGPERAWWNVLRYDIEVKPDYLKKEISGYSQISATVLKPGKTLQLDLQVPMEIDSIIYVNETNASQAKLNYKRDGNAWFVDFENELTSKSFIIRVYFHGKPKEAKMPPWDGGWIWKKDKNGAPWMSVACQGLGASVWYPCKDHQSDEPDKGASLTMIVPDTLVAVGNGRLKSQTKKGKLAIYTWEVVNPINNYNIIPYIGKYVHFGEIYKGEKGKLDCDYWVLAENLEKAKAQFTQVPKMLKSFEYWFGPYPFYEDGFKLVESPHLGMEHQSAVAYGNQYKNGYLGKDLSGTGEGLKWDFIIIHESGHEWFANNITSNDIADMWIHEGFTAYSETLYTTSEFGVAAGNEYVIGTRNHMDNDIPIIGKYGVQQEGSGDMYYKGANMLHTIRQIIDNDERFRLILRGLNAEFYHKTVDTKDIEAYISKQAGKNFSKVFDQYLRTTQIPVLEYTIDKQIITYRWTNCVKGFNMPVKIIGEGKTQWIIPSPDWQTGKLGPEFINGITTDPNMYVTSKKVDAKSVY
ncbi:M1 family metallopeptidase [Flavitalea sp.]|nr:M1 family metallopeptidase [Flavitalea sp.]